VTVLGPRGADGRSRLLFEAVGLLESLDRAADPRFRMAREAQYWDAVGRGRELYGADFAEEVRQAFRERQAYRRVRQPW
jgi:hypothetical protein